MDNRPYNNMNVKYEMCENNMIYYQLGPYYYRLAFINANMSETRRWQNVIYRLTTGYFYRGTWETVLQLPTLSCTVCRRSPAGKGMVLGASQEHQTKRQMAI